MGFSSFPLWALSGSIIDPALSATTEKTNQTVETSLKLKISRNLRIPSQGFFNINQENHILNTLSVNADLTISVPSKRFSHFKNVGYLNNKSLLAVLSYSSPVLYNSSKIKEDHCWRSVFCLRNLSLGVVSAPFKRKNFHGTYSIYLNFPVSKFRVQKQSHLLGLGAALNTEHKLFSNGGFYISALSSHFFDLDGYVYTTAKWHNSYNRPLSMAHQLGIRAEHSLLQIIPTLYAHVKHGSSFSFSGLFHQQVNVNLSAVWLAGKKLRILAGLRWGDEVLSQNINPQTKREVFADDIYVTFGGNYLF